MTGGASADKAELPSTLPMFTQSEAASRIEVSVEREAGVPSSRQVVLDADFVRIGSHPSNDLVLADPGVSRFHCRLTREGGAWRLVDTGSLNGTRIAGVPARDADLPMPACTIELGGTLLRVRESPGAARVELSSRPSYGGLFGTSVAMRKMFAMLERVAKSDANVLVEGESGTGKELVATEIVRRGPRADRPFVIVDCSTISPQLVESVLFGHLRGSFTGADRDRAGAFEAADGGTVFLDEIGEMPLDLQPKLLRVLESREVRRLGETRARPVDVRIIAATNRRLEREMNRGRFREDLYFRLSVVSVRVPPLRERLDDLAVLVPALLDALDAPDSAHLFTPEVMASLRAYDWPGNVRELRNYIERTVVLQSAGPAAQEETDTDPESQADPVPAPNIEVPIKLAKERLVAAFEKRYLVALLAWAGGNVSKAARKANMDRMNLHRLIQRYGLRGPMSLRE